MTKKVLLSALLLLSPAALACPGNPNCGMDHGTAAADPAATATAVLAVQGMTCGRCAKSIEAELGRVDGVGSVTVDLDAARVTVTYDPARTNPEALAQRVDAIGFKATVAQGS